MHWIFRIVVHQQLLAAGPAVAVLVDALSELEDALLLPLLLALPGCLVWSQLRKLLLRQLLVSVLVKVADDVIHHLEQRDVAVLGVTERQEFVDVQGVGVRICCLEPARFVEQDFLFHTSLQPLVVLGVVLGIVIVEALFQHEVDVVLVPGYTAIMIFVQCRKYPEVVPNSLAVVLFHLCSYPFLQFFDAQLAVLIFVSLRINAPQQGVVLIFRRRLSAEQDFFSVLGIQLSISFHGKPFEVIWRLDDTGVQLIQFDVREPAPVEVGDFVANVPFRQRSKRPRCVRL
uniref:Putative secreted protein n=1 Tax=Ixodes ricinus TaxID=34613 RepID=A0A6B0V962_IXORI